MNNQSAKICGAIAGGALAAGESFQPTLTPRSTAHQALVTAGCVQLGTATGAAAGGLLAALVSRTGLLPESVSRPLSGPVPITPPGLVGAGICLVAGVGGLLRGRRLRRAQLANYQEWQRPEQNPAVAAVAGVAAGAGLAAAGVGVTSGSRRVRAQARGWFPGRSVVGPALVTAGGMGVLAGLLTSGRVLGLRKLAEIGRAPDRSLQARPGDEFVSGGPRSLIEYDTLSREGRRFVNWRVGAAQIRQRLGVESAVEPVRAFVGLDSAPGVAARVELALAELDRLGAWDRSAILVVSPAGSGYANSVPVEAMELIRGGDCASVVVQYGLLPSMLSLSLRDTAAETFRLLVDRIAERIAELPGPARPLLFGFGESLGALSAELGILQEPALVDRTTGKVAELDALLLVGTPPTSAVREHRELNPNFIGLDRWQDLPSVRRPDAQLWFLDHDADPVTRFSASLLLSRPPWLVPGVPRGRGVPEEMRWIPVFTWVQVLLDLIYATQAQSGVFQSVGHDYRVDLAPVVAAAFCGGIDADLPLVQRVLSEQEVARDSRLRLDSPGIHVEPAEQAIRHGE